MPTSEASQTVVGSPPRGQADVLKQLRGLILGGQFPAEQHLQEAKLAEILGVSRTPVREALISLKNEGLLTHHFNRGFFVRQFTLREIQNAYEVRAALEGLACRLAAERGLSREMREKLEKELAEGDRLLSPGKLLDEAYVPFRDMNERFHQLILDAIDNPLLSDLTNRSMAMPMSSSRVVHWGDYEGMSVSHRHHHVILRAIVRGQGARAEALMSEHICQSSEELAKAWPKVVLEKHESVAVPASTVSRLSDSWNGLQVRRI